MKVRCSSISKFMTKPKGNNKISEGAKTAVRELARFHLFGYENFDGNKYTAKGNQLEEQAIKLSGFSRGLVLKKNSERKENDWVSGECDIYVPSRKLIIDTKCSWDIGSHPFFPEEAEEKAKKSGYDYQMQGYMWLWEAEEAQIDFVLFPTPLDLIPAYEDSNKLVDLVEQIPQEKRITTLTIKRDEKIIGEIKERITAAQDYFQQIAKPYL
ncbi:translocation protein TolB precursor [Pasteurellaceae bacterium Macca]|nr:translocation protein TolB precursor [Pasteurellaceae bacterium Macca]MCK3656084.1 translocation protein TolB precursor [Pasteurellaceae bacterium Macca]MCK3656670.1 translocation protein TolB precursor [Pasteurellaceae bacterium Macca]MCK3656701.1 translocation protein TolB precursor [Pasteurellaceae bacterium Macca]MCK3657116.1 translocation protein TolB precursor [Pasteurellaceae bacterium Macca]